VTKYSRAYATFGFPLAGYQSVAVPEGTSKEQREKLIKWWTDECQKEVQLQTGNPFQTKEDTLKMYYVTNLDVMGIIMGGFVFNVVCLC
jgi:hypothetical protein